MEQKSLHEYLEKEHQGAKQSIQNDMQANQIIRKIEELEEKKKLNKIIARSEIDRIKKWRDEVNHELDRQIKQYKKLIHDYMARFAKQRKTLP